ncbi:MAG: dicarboxylate/amino acid:cation symporter [Hyphomicrobiales bacterium]
MTHIKKIAKNLVFQILLAMLLGIVVGVVMDKEASMFAPLGTLFIQLIKMLVIPLVFVSIIAGAASLGATKSAGKLGLGTLAYFLGTTAFAVIMALTLGHVFQPGAGLSLDSMEGIFSMPEGANSATAPGFWESLLGAIPTNPIKALVEGNILQIIVFGMFMGIGISVLDKKKKTVMINGLNYITEALVWMVKVVMYVAPIGVFGLMADAIGTFGFSILGLVAKLLVVYLVAVAIMGVGVFPLTLKLFSKTNLRKFFSAMTKPQMIAFSSASSMAALPENMEVCEKEMGVSKGTSSFVLPLGATINMAGNAIYYALVATFFAQIYHIDLTTGQYVAIILTSTLGSIGQAGVPGPTLLVAAVLIAADIPITGLPLLYALDRIFDMIRTTLNITGDACCAVIVDRFNKEEVEAEEVVMQAELEEERA